MGEKICTQRQGDSLILTWDDNTTVFDLSSLREAWIVRLGDSFAGPNERVLVLVEEHSFVPVCTAVPGLMAAVRPDLEHLQSEGNLRCADAVRMPRSWSIGLAILPTANVAPIRRARSELAEASKGWNIGNGNCLEEAFS